MPNYPNQEWIEIEKLPPIQPRGPSEELQCFDESYYYKNGKGAINEIAGYQFADCLSLPIPKVSFFIFKSKEGGKRGYSKVADLGLLIEKIADWKNYIQLGELNENNQHLFLQSLLYLTFFRSEPFEILYSKYRTTLIDLETFLAEFHFNSDLRQNSECCYFDTAFEEWFNYCRLEARKAKCENQYIHQLRNLLSSNKVNEFKFNFGNHPHTDLISFPTALSNVLENWKILWRR